MFNSLEKISSMKKKFVTKFVYIKFHFSLANGICFVILNWNKTIENELKAKLFDKNNLINPILY